MPAPLSYEALNSLLPEAGLFRGESPWRLSPSPYLLTKKEAKELHSIGHVLAKFYDACNVIYHASATRREHEWVAELLDAGKPEWLIRLQRSGEIKKRTPLVIRPDLMVTDGGFSISELDSVPGGQGITAFLSSIYADAGWSVFGGRDGIRDGFRAAHPGGAEILVSQESSDYRKEMEYLAGILGEGFSCSGAEDVLIGRDGNENSPQSFYRFFELFDTENIPSARTLLEAAGQGFASVSPPPVPHLEEKLWLALFHTPGLQKTWKKLLRGSHWERLQQLIPHGWPIVPSSDSPHAALPWLNVHGWDDVAAMSQKERRLVLKISGFNESAWGARGVFIGHDLPGEEWKVRLDEALAQCDSSPWILQEFCQGRVVEHPCYEEGSGEVRMMKGRVRLCPYYYRLPDGSTYTGGCLATIVPEDKKKIHGMKDAILMPCSLPSDD